jgi:predicted alpha/beta hydrolase
MPAALSWLHQMYPNLPKHLVGHSAGGLLFGLMPNYKLLSSVVAVGCSTGYVKQIALPYRLVAYAILKFYFPIAVKIFGYVPAKKLGWGEDLPVAVGAQWADWCLNPGYVSNAFGKEITTNYFEELYLPMLVLNVKDDPIASAKNVEAMKQLFPNTAIETIWIDPSLYGLKTVGHIGFFRQTNKVLWPKVTEWLQGFGSSLS